MIVLFYYTHCPYGQEIVKRIQSKPEVRRFFVLLDALSNETVLLDYKIEYVPALLFDPMLKPIEGYAECKSFLQDFEDELNAPTPLLPKSAPVKKTVTFAKEEPLFNSQPASTSAPPSRMEGYVTTNEKVQENDLKSFLQQRQSLESMIPKPESTRLPPLAM